MNRAEPQAAAVQRLKPLSLVVFGCFIVLMIDTVLELLTIHPGPGAYARYARAVGMLVGGIATMVITFRIARYSKLPGAAAILLLMAVVVATAILSHFS